MKERKKKNSLTLTEAKIQHFRGCGGYGLVRSNDENKKKKMTDASNDACSSGAVRSTASVSRLGLFQGVPEEADKAGCKVELAQNYRT